MHANVHARDNSITTCSSGGSGSGISGHATCGGGSTPRQIAPVSPAVQLFDSHAHEYGDGEAGGASLLSFCSPQQLCHFLRQRFPRVSLPAVLACCSSCHQPLLTTGMACMRVERVGRRQPEVPCMRGFHGCMGAPLHAERVAEWASCYVEHGLVCSTRRRKASAVWMDGQRG